MPSLARWGKRVLRTSPRAAFLVPLLDRLGARTSATRVARARTGDGVVVVELPSRAGGTPGRVGMHLHEGRDQVARALRDGGWSGFEPPLPSFVAGFLARCPGTFLDVGANTGLYSLIAVGAHPDNRAVAYEPVPAIAELLAANVALNDAGQRIRLDDAAIGEQTGTATIHLPPPQLDGTIETSASLEPDFKEVIAETFEVRTSTLDDAWRALGRPRVTMVKVDVEGSEARVLQGATEVLATCRPVVSVEVLGRLDTAPVEAIRAAIGFTDVALGEHQVTVGRPRVVVDPTAPNHLLVPPERLVDVTAELRKVPGIAIVLDADAPAAGGSSSTL